MRKVVCRPVLEPAQLKWRLCTVVGIMHSLVVETRNLFSNSRTVHVLFHS